MKDAWDPSGTRPDEDYLSAVEEFKRGDKWGGSIMDNPQMEVEQIRLNREAWDRLADMTKAVITAPVKKVEYQEENAPLYPEGWSPAETSQGWSKAETPAGRKLMKEGDSPFHFDSHKPRVEQLPAGALMEVAKVFTYGAKKYGDHNWARYWGEWQWGQLIGSTLRHVYAWMMREDLDRESGLPHLDHAAANLLMLIDLIKAGNTSDDRSPIGTSPTETRKGNIGTL